MLKDEIINSPKESGRELDSGKTVSIIHIGNQNLDKLNDLNIENSDSESLEEYIAKQNVEIEIEDGYGDSELIDGDFLGNLFGENIKQEIVEDIKKDIE